MLTGGLQEIWADELAVFDCDVNSEILHPRSYAVLDFMLPTVPSVKKKSASVLARSNLAAGNFVDLVDLVDSSTRTPRGYIVRANKQTKSSRPPLIEFLDGT